MKAKLYQVDSFANKPFTGNPAGVCLLDSPASEQWMQDIAMEMNLSETAFLWPIKDGKFSLRWFTPSVEVNLCGHATLAASHILWEQDLLAVDEKAYFYTKSGELSALKKGDDIFLNFPSQPVHSCEIPGALKENFKTQILFCGLSPQKDLLVELESQNQVLDFEPRIDLLKPLNLRVSIMRSSQPNQVNQRSYC